MGIGLKFVYEGHRVKVKVTGAKMVEHPYFHNEKTSIGNNSSSVTHRVVKFACSMGLWRIEWCDRHFCHVAGSDHACGQPD